MCKRLKARESFSELIYIQFVNPGFTQDYVDFTIDHLKATNASPGKISQVMEQAKMWGSTGWQIVFYLGETMALGIICSLIAAAILRTKHRNKC